MDVCGVSGMYVRVKYNHVVFCRISKVGTGDGDDGM